MALIKDDFIEVELSEGNKVIVRDFSAVLLKSEYENLVAGIEDLINNKLRNLYIETIEPLFILRIDKKIQNYVIKIEAFNTNGKQSEEYEFNLDEENVKCFLKDLKYDIEHVKDPQKLP